MKVQEYIAELLYDYNRLIIPNFGAFIGTPRSAKIDLENNVIQPPSKDILFNDKLTINDELLITKIAEKERIVKQAAVEKMKLFVSDLKEELVKDGTVYFENLGSFVQKPSGEIVFEQDEKMNFLNDAYGLNPVDLPQVKKENTAAAFVETPTESAEETVLENEEVVTEEVEAEESVLEEQAIEETIIEEEEIQEIEMAAIENDTVEKAPLAEINEDSNTDVIESAETAIVANEAKNIEIDKAAMEETATETAANENVVNETNDVIATINDDDDGGFKWWYAALPLLALLIGGFFVWQFISKDSKNPYAKTDNKTQVEKQPTKTSPQPVLTDTVKTASNNTAETENTNTDLKEEKTKPIANNTTENTKPTNTNSSANNSQTVTGSFDPIRGYYIVIGSVKGKSTAATDASKWKKKGYEAHVLPGPNGYNRIGLYVGKDKNEATSQLTKYKSEIISSAWLLQN